MKKEEYNKELLEIKKECGWWGSPYRYTNLSKFVKMKKELDKKWKKK